MEPEEWKFRVVDNVATICRDLIKNTADEEEQGW